MSAFRVLRMNESKKLIKTGHNIKSLWGRFFIMDKNKKLKFPNNIIGAISEKHIGVLINGEKPKPQKPKPKQEEPIPDFPDL